MTRIAHIVLGEIVPANSIFTTRTVARMAETTPDVATRALRTLEAAGLVTHLTRGLWAAMRHPDFSAYVVVPFLLERERSTDGSRQSDRPSFGVSPSGAGAALDNRDGWADILDLDAPTDPRSFKGYVSVTSALHLRGMLSQIPREIHVVARVQRAPAFTPAGTYVFHRLMADVFGGAEAGDHWARFALATPAKALVDTMYLSVHRGRQFTYLPEIELPYPARIWHAEPNRRTSAQPRLASLSADVEAHIDQLPTSRLA